MTADPNEDPYRQALLRILAATRSHLDGRDLLGELHPRRTIDIKVRCDAVETWYEGDWLSDLWREVKAARELVAPASVAEVKHE